MFNNNVIPKQDISDVDGGTPSKLENKTQSRRGTLSEWTSTNPILSEGEKGFEKDTNKLKFGDGVTTWNSLPYFNGTGTVGEGLDKWVAGTAYEVNDVKWLQTDNTIYVCTTGNNDVVFTPDNWQKLSVDPNTSGTNTGD
jgi:hypothetical protein